MWAHFTSIFVAVFSIAIPAVTLVMLLTNAIAVRVLLAHEMRNATNLILLALAVANTLTGVAPLPFTLQAHTFGGKHDFLPYGWACGPLSSLAFWTGTFSEQSKVNMSCDNSSAFKDEQNLQQIAQIDSESYVNICLQLRTVFHDLLPVAGHTASAWLMVLLAFQRYLHVCHSVAGSRILPTKRVRVVLLAIAALAFATQAPVLAEFEFAPRLVESLMDSHKLFWGVVRYNRNWMLSEWREIYQVDYIYSVYFIKT